MAKEEKLNANQNKKTYQRGFDPRAYLRHYTGDNRSRKLGMEIVKVYFYQKQIFLSTENNANCHLKKQAEHNCPALRCEANYFCYPYE